MKRVFITGANGFVGSAVTKELLAHGYQVLGLSRSEAGVEKLKALGADTLLGDVNDEAIIKSGIEQSDAVIHTAFNHDFSTFFQNCQDDFNLIQTFGKWLKGTNKPLIVTSGAMYSGKEKNCPAGADIVTPEINPRAMSDLSTAQLVDEGVNAMVVGLPQVHNSQRFGLVTYYIGMARTNGYAAYIGEGTNVWTAAHISDVASFYRLVLERGESGNKYLAVAESKITLKQIAATVAKRFEMEAKSIPVSEAGSYFGPLAHLAHASFTAECTNTERETLGWKTKGPLFLDDLANAEVE